VLRPYSEKRERVPHFTIPTEDVLEGPKEIKTLGGRVRKILLFRSGRMLCQFFERAHLLFAVDDGAFWSVKKAVCAVEPLALQ
jgi:hypothetical protein